MYSRRDYGLSRAYNVRATKEQLTTSEHSSHLIAPGLPREEDYNSLAPGQLIQFTGAGCRI